MALGGGHGSRREKATDTDRRHVIRLKAVLKRRTTHLSDNDYEFTLADGKKYTNRIGVRSCIRWTNETGRTTRHLPGSICARIESPWDR
jgi:hypothetical protein